MCSWPENLCTPGVVQCTVFYMLWHFRTLEGKEKGVSVVISCYICATVCGWARIFMILNAPLGLCNVECSTLWHFKNLRRVMKRSEYFCDESCFWCGSIILQPSVGSCVIKWCSGLMKLVLN